jgi:hypothetical protein
VRNDEAPAPDGTAPDSGSAGASAQRRGDRLHRQRGERIDARFGWLAGIVKFLTDDPQSTQAWSVGAQGERELAASLERRLGDQAVLLHDRQRPRSTANIDHLAVAASGVWVIDAKRYAGRIERRDEGGFFRTDLRLRVGGRDRTPLVPKLHDQEADVRLALGDEDVPVHLVLCFVDPEGWGLLQRPFQIDRVWVTSPRRLAQQIASEGPLDRDDVLRVAHLLAGALPPAVG